LQPEGATQLKRSCWIQQGIEAIRAEARAGKADNDFDKDTVQRWKDVQPYPNDAQLGHILNVPPLDPEVSRDHWVSSGASLLDSTRPANSTRRWACSPAWPRRMGNRTLEFNRAVVDYQQWLTPKFAKEVKKARRIFYNDVKAFLHATIIYIFAFVLAGGAVLNYALLPNLSEALRRSAFYLISSLAWFIRSGLSSAWCSKADRRSRTCTPRRSLSLGAMVLGSSSKKSTASASATPWRRSQVLSRS